MEMFYEYLLSALSLLFVFVAIGFCVFSHELGHFLAGKLLGLHIDAFAIGFKAVWKKKIGGVEYRVGCLPFGGYVELPQIDSSEAVPKAADGSKLPLASPRDRIITAVAGPLFNILSGLLIGCVVWMVGLPQESPKMREIVVLDIDQTGPEYAAGLRKNDKIVKLNGDRFYSTWMQFVNKMLFIIGDVELGVERNGEYSVIRYTPKPNPNAPASKAEGIVWPYFSPLIPIELHPEKNSIAEKAGVRPGDLLVEVDGHRISELHEFQYHLDLAAGKPVVLTLRRGAELIQITAKPEPIPDLSEEFTRYQTGIVIATAKDGGAEIVRVAENSPAAKAGLVSEDRIVKANGKTIAGAAEFIELLKEIKIRPFELTYLRGGKEFSVKLAAQKIVPHTLGLTVSFTDHPTPFQQFYFTLDMSYKSLRGILVHVGNRLGLTQSTSSLRPGHMSGPLGIGLVLYNSARYAPFIHAVHFVVIVSFALAIFNLLPLPVLDGGHIFFGLLEILTGKPLPVKVAKVLATVFVTLLIALMVFVTFSDVKRIGRTFFPNAFSNADAPPEAEAEEENHAK